MSLRYSVRFDCLISGPTILNCGPLSSSIQFLRDVLNILLHKCFLVCTVISYSTIFSPLQFMALMPHTRALNRGGKSAGHSLHLWPLDLVIKSYLILRCHCLSHIMSSLSTQTTSLIYAPNRSIPVPSSV